MNEMTEIPLNQKAANILDYKEEDIPYQSSSLRKVITINLD